MQIGMVGLGRMGANMVRRLVAGRHECVAFDVNSAAVAATAKDGATGAASLAAFAAALKTPRAIWMMVPAAVVDETIDALVPHLSAGDILIDGGNSHYVDVGTSGGVWGADRGYCLMIGGETDIAQHLDSIFSTLAPSMDSEPRTPARAANAAPAGTAERGYLHCGPNGAGHFVKMIHNGIEYGMMAALAEGLNVLRHADIGTKSHDQDAETTPLRNPEHYQYDFNLADVTEVWRRGSVVASWLLDLTANALARDPNLGQFSGRVSDSGEGRWTIAAAIDEGVPAPVLSAALYERFSSRGQADFANQVLSAMRFEFGGHAEKKA